MSNGFFVDPQEATGINPVEEFQDLGISVDDAYDYITAGFWPTEVRGYLDGGLKSIEEMKSLAAFGVSGETFGLLARIGITDQKEIAHLATADEDWYTLHTCISNGLRSYEDLAYIVDRKIAAATIRHAASFTSELTIQEVARAHSDSYGLSDRQKEEAIALTLSVFGDAAEKILAAHKYPHALVSALNALNLSPTLAEMREQERKRQEVISMVLSLPSEMVRSLAQLCEGQFDLHYRSIPSLIDILSGEDF